MTTKPPEQRARLPLLRLLRKGRNGIVLGFALVVFFLGCLRVFMEHPDVERLEGIAHDSRFKMRASLPRSQHIAIVGVTASSFSQFDLAPLAEKHEAVRMMRDAGAWPWPREIHALVIERLFALGARAVAVDIAFPSSRPGDVEFAAVLKKHAGHVVLATLVQSSSTPDGAKKVILLPPCDTLANAAGAGSEGLVVYHADDDTIVRRFDFRSSELREAGLKDDTRDLPYFATRAAEAFSGRQFPDRYREVINFSGARTYDYIPVEDIFDDTRVAEHGRRADGGDAFRGKLVFYGPTAEAMHDIHPTPFGMMPGVEIHAQLAASMLTGRYITDAPRWASWLLAFLTTIGSALLVLRLRSPLMQTLALGVLLALSYAGTQLAFSHSAILFPTAPWVLGIVATGAFGIVYLFFLEQREKAHTRKVLERSVNKRIAKVLLANAEEFETARRGEKRAVAILFSDIRSFTTWSEQAQPEHLVGQLNEYFEKMVEIIEQDDSLGNAQKFIGDAILAAWGDTPENRFGDDGNAARAIIAAFRMRAALTELNVLWDKRPDRIVISIGIGINIGDVVVGEVGHPDRREYTVLGDGVNFAARLESATKQFHTDCLVGEGVEQLTRERFRFRLVGSLRVKGKSRPVRVFTPISDIATPAPVWLDDYHRAIALHDRREFPDAIALFRDVKARIGADDFLCDWYLGKCEAFLTAPPPPEWDASHVLADK